MLILLLLLQQEIPGQKEVSDAFIDVSPFLWFGIVILLFGLWYMWTEKNSAQKDLKEARESWNEERKGLLETQRDEIGDLVARFQRRIDNQQNRINEQSDYNRRQDQKNLEMLKNVVNAVDKIMSSFEDFKQNPPFWFIKFKENVLKRISELE